VCVCVLNKSYDLLFNTHFIYIKCACACACACACVCLSVSNIYIHMYIYRCGRRLFLVYAHGIYVVIGPFFFQKNNKYKNLLHGIYVLICPFLPHPPRNTKTKVELPLLYTCMVYPSCT